ncbi:5-formyltetrahydrofolate cyclo-ligase [Lagierella sp.]|uniref:5-formyltetrahydrofolate cyclo-ligase n=1 Tax=Lagierella sp. TaxID=2849657 RepID=UPI0026111003|nr:5-formyltetrahydrofolate cyclo-ligase [Lagierella sp.]
MDKKTIRKKIISKRDELPFDKKEKMDEQIVKRFKDLKFIEEHENIFSYVSFGSEINVGDILSEILKQKKNLYVPYIDKEDKKMYLCKIEDLSKDLERGYYGIREPKKNLRIPINNDIIDLVISPGVAFTKEKYRIGYGGGYYDRFFASLNSSPLVVALAYDFQVLPELPIDSYDIPVDMIITEKQIIR